MPYKLILKKVPHFGSYSAEFFKPFNSSLVGWGVGAGAAVSLFMSSVPLYQADVLDRFPPLKKYFEQGKLPASDLPF